jgi:hypothetical protein
MIPPPCHIDEKGALPYKPRQLDAMNPVVAGRPFLGPEMARLRPAGIGVHISFIRQIVALAGKLSAENDP